MSHIFASVAVTVYSKQCSVLASYAKLKIVGGNIYAHHEHQVYDDKEDYIFVVFNSYARIDNLNYERPLRGIFYNLRSFKRFAHAG